MIRWIQTIPVFLAFAGSTAAQDKPVPTPKPQEKPAKPKHQTGFFAFDKLWRIDLTVQADAWDSMYFKR